MAENRWTFLTNHAHVLVCLSRNPRTRLRDVAVEVGITERATHRIVSDLQNAGYIQIRKEGRRNVYNINPTLPLRHPLEAPESVGALLSVFCCSFGDTPKPPGGKGKHASA